MSKTALDRKSKSSRKKARPRRPASGAPDSTIGLDGSTLGERLRMAREARGINQVEIAETCECSRAAVSQWELGQTQPSFDSVNRVANMLRLPTEWLMNGRGKPPEFQSPNLERAAGVDAKRAFGGTKRAAAITRLELIPEQDSGTVTLDGPVRDYWRLPRAVVNELLRSRPDQLVFTRVISDAMEPTLPFHSYALIDTSRTDVSDGLIYALDNGFGLVLRRLQATDDPATITLVADRAGVAPLTVPRKRVKIAGRLVGLMSFPK
jgi:transcriptional regulator with XRE-family HTH domain